MAWASQEAELRVTHLLWPGDAVDAWRAIKRDEPRPADFESNHAKGKAARGIERRSAPMWMSVSMTTTREATESRVRQWPVLGTHVAHIVLRGAEGLAMAETLDEAHLSVWGDPFKLAKCVVDVYPVE